MSFDKSPVLLAGDGVAGMCAVGLPCLELNEWRHSVEPVARSSSLRSYHFVFVFSVVELSCILRRVEARVKSLACWTINI